MSGEDATFNALRRSPFHQVIKECIRRQGKIVFPDANEYISSQGWTVKEFCVNLNKISNAEWLEIIGG